MNYKEKKYEEPSWSQVNDTPFTILNTASDINYLYRLNSPFQVTYEYCNGTSADDYLNILSLSENGVTFFQESIGLHNHLVRNKAPHSHDHYEFLIVLEGSLTQRIEGKDYLYPTGYSCLINRNLFHIESFNEPTKVLFLGLSVDFIKDLINLNYLSYFSEETKIKDTFLYEFITSDINHPNRKAYLDFIPTLCNTEPHKTLHTFAEALISTIMFPKFGSTYVVNGLLCSILQYLSDPLYYHCTYAELENNGDYLLFSRAEHLLEENDGRISRAELSHKLNYSGDYLNRIIKKYTGMCLHDYSMQFCMKKAAQYLSETNEPISYIMARLSFSNRTYFYHLFKEQYKMTPQEYRKKFS